MAKKKKEEVPPPDPNAPPAPLEDVTDNGVEVKPEPPVPPDPMKVIKVDLYATGHYETVPAPQGWFRDRRISLKRKEMRGTPDSGYVEVEAPVNLEHVDDDEHGVWCYRVM